MLIMTEDDKNFLYRLSFDVSEYIKKSETLTMKSNPEDLERFSHVIHHKNVRFAKLDLGIIYSKCLFEITKSIEGYKGIYFYQFPDLMTDSLSLSCEYEGVRLGLVKRQYHYAYEYYIDYKFGTANGF